MATLGSDDLECGAVASAVKTVSIREAKTRLTELARQVENGETIVVTRHGRPIFEMVPHRPKGGLNLQAGRDYLAKHGYTNPLPYVADDFDDPLPEDFLIRPLPDE